MMKGMDWAGVINGRVRRRSDSCRVVWVVVALHVGRLDLFSRRAGEIGNRER
jgi:hypothetical protein